MAYAVNLPDSTQFVTVDELRKFNIDDSDGEVKAAKAYFGNNNHQWWIAGNQNTDSTTLFAASPLRITLKDLGITYFITFEQSLMKNTTIYIDDVKKECIFYNR